VYKRCFPKPPARISSCCANLRPWFIGMSRWDYGCSLVGYPSWWGISWSMALWYWWTCPFQVEGLSVSQALVLTGECHWSSRPKYSWQSKAARTGIHASCIPAVPFLVRVPCL
jgi:hypothetical protein